RPALRGAQPQRPADRLEHVERRPPVPALLEPRVPGGAHPGELRDLLTPEPRRAPAAAVRQADVLRFEARAFLAQEVGELRTAPLAVCAQFHPRGFGRDLDFDGGCFYYQDNSLPCTWINVAPSYTHALNNEPPRTTPAQPERPPVGRLPGSVHGHPRRRDRQRRVALDPQRTRLLDHRTAMGRQRLHPHLRRTADARRALGRPARTPARVPRRHGDVRVVLA